jgi:uncharacterized membrane protein
MSAIPKLLSGIRHIRTSPKPGIDRAGTTHYHVVAGGNPGTKMTHIQAGDRYWEIDATRGIAIVMMILFHILFDLTFLGIAPWPGSVIFWRIFAFLTATLFLFLVGISYTISAAHASRYMDRRAFFLKYLKRGLGIFALGMLVTAVTWLYLGTGYVVFGILHLIGLSIILAPLFFRFTWGNLVAGTGIILLGFLIRDISGPAYLLWLGIHPDLFYSVDYTPLIPWFGVVLIGMFAGKILYPEGRKIFLADLKPPSLVRGLMFLGRHSLLIYLLHQPVIIIILTLLTIL